MVSYVVRKFSFCSHLFVDVLANIFFLHIFIDLKAVFILWNDPIQIGTFTIHKKRLSSHVAINFIDDTRY